MGGRSATSGVKTFGRKTGTRLTPKQYKSAVSDEANFIFNELHQNPAVQNIIRKSFRGTTAQVSFIVSGGGEVTSRSFVEQLDALSADFARRVAEQQRIKKDSSSWSAYDVARAKMQALQQTLDELNKLKRKQKKE